MFGNSYETVESGVYVILRQILGTYGRSFAWRNVELFTIS